MPLQQKRVVLANGIELDVVDEGPRDAPVLIFLHGFPESHRTWRNQIPHFSGRFRCIAPDQRGYGASDSPAGIRSFDLEHLTSDLAGLLDALEIERAVFAGHDWGGFVAWGMPIAYPERTAGVIGVNTPYVPFPDTATLRLAFDDDAKLYILWFQKPGVAEAVLDRDPRLVFDKLMRRLGRIERALPTQARIFPFNVLLMDMRRRLRTGKALV